MRPFRLFARPIFSAPAKNPRNQQKSQNNPFLAAITPILPGKKDRYPRVVEAAAGHACMN
jgi:hypothetical protein